MNQHDTLRFTAAESCEPKVVPPIEPPDNHAGKFIDRQGVKWEQPENSFGFTTVRVLPMLEGKPWNDLTLAVVGALNPTAIRVVTPDIGLTLDGMTGRITVILAGNKCIRSVLMELRVWLPEGVHSGYHLIHSIELPFTSCNVGARTAGNLAAVQKVKFNPDI